MDTPLQLSISEGTQVHIHLGPGVRLAGTGQHDVDPAAEPAAPLQRRPLLLSLAALSLFGLGYAVHVVVGKPAVALSPTPAAVTQYAPPMPLPSVPGPFGSNTPSLDPRLAMPLSPSIQIQRPSLLAPSATPPNASPTAPASPFAPTPAPLGARRSAFGLE